MSKAPSAILSDALASFNRAATLAFTAAQDQARKDVTYATADAREARRERDEAVNALHASRLEEHAWKEEAGSWKATANQAELTINHHLETIAQLREEAIQWKNQCLRLEETSRREAVSWKEQFLRVEQERSKLARRVEELVAEHLGPGGHAQTSTTVPYTPILRYSTAGELSASARLQCASAVDLSPAHPPKSTPPTSKATSSAHRNRTGPAWQLPTPLSENQRSARQRATQQTVSQSGPTSNGTRQILIRRVQAVVEVPVKEESVDREDLGPITHISTAASDIPSASSSSSVPTPAPVPRISNAPLRTAEPGKPASRTKRKASMKRTYVEIDDGSESDDASQRRDAEEYQPVSDGDDELLMGIEVNRREVYGMKRVGQVAPKTSPLTVLKKRKALPPTKKSRPSTTSKS